MNETEQALAYEIRRRVAAKLGMLVSCLPGRAPAEQLPLVGVAVGENLVLVKHGEIDADSHDSFRAVLRRAVDETMEELGVPLWHVL